MTIYLDNQQITNETWLLLFPCTCGETPVQSRTNIQFYETEFICPKGHSQRFTHEEILARCRTHLGSQTQ